LNAGKKGVPRTTVHLTQRVLADFSEIDRHSIQAWGRKVADQYLDEMSSALDRLQANPEILRLEPDFAPGLFFYRVKRNFWSAIIRVPKSLF
jgi:plasmid stabilization system protein ParE